METVMKTQSEIRGSQIDKIFFDEYAALERRAIKAMEINNLFKGDPRQLPPLTLKGTVTGRTTMRYNPCVEIPVPGFIGHKNYLFRNRMLIGSTDTYYALPDELHVLGQHGDVLLRISSKGKHQVYFWRGKKKHYWRRVDPRKFPSLLPQLKAALLLQS